MRQPATVGRGQDGDAAQLAAAGDLQRAAAAVGIEAPDLFFRWVGPARRGDVANGVDVAAVVAECCRPAAGIRRRRQFGAAHRPGALRHDAPAQHQRHPRAIGCRRAGAEVELRARHPAHALGVGVAAQRDVQALVATAGQVDQTQVGAQRVDHPCAGDRGAADVPAAVARVLAQAAAVRVHAPQVELTVAVGQKGHAQASGAGVRHRALRVAFCRQQGHGLGAPGQRDAPQLRRRPATVSADVVAVQPAAGEEQRLGIGAERAIAGLGDRQCPPRQRLRVDREKLGHRFTARRRRRQQHLSGWREAPDAGVLAVPGDALRQAAIQRHEVGLAGPFVGSAEGHRAAVGRQRRARFEIRVRGDAFGAAARETHTPEITFRREDDGVATQTGKPIETLARSVFRHRRGGSGGRRLGARCSANTQHTSQHCPQQTQQIPLP